MGWAARRRGVTRASRSLVAFVGRGGEIELVEVTVPIAQTSTIAVVVVLYSLETRERPGLASPHTCPLELDAFMLTFAHALAALGKCRTNKTAARHEARTRRAISAFILEPS